MDAPDPERVGGIAWLERTNGALTVTERRRLRRAILRGQLSGAADRIRLLTGRRATEPMAVPSPPDSALARDAERAAAEQPAILAAHAYRTWAFGRALAAVDGAASLDEELFYVASLLHDAGLDVSVPGEDFTLRSGRIAAGVVEPHRDHGAVRSVQDAISAHCTPGATVAVDGPEAFYVQAGATLDLGGLRLPELTGDLVDAVLDAYPRTGVVADIAARVRAEAAAVPEGRFGLLNRTGFVAAVRISPLPR
ncbi:MAG: hypothetical protein R2695_06830 [Acidimicrobiales bacterium]